MKKACFPTISVVTTNVIVAGGIFVEQNMSIILSQSHNAVIWKNGTLNCTHRLSIYIYSSFIFRFNMVASDVCIALNVPSFGWHCRMGRNEDRQGRVVVVRRIRTYVTLLTDSSTLELTTMDCEIHIINIHQHITRIHLTSHSFTSH